MAAQDKKSVIKDLIELGKSKGKLTTKEITDALEELDFDVEKVDKLYDTLEGLNIEIIEDLEQDIDLDLNSIPVTAASEEEEEAPPSEGVNIDDPVKVYLKEIGRGTASEFGRGGRTGAADGTGGQLCEKAPVRGKPAAGGQHCQALCGTGHAVFGSDPGGESGG